LKIPITKKGWQSGSGEGPEFMPQYVKKKKKGILEGIKGIPGGEKGAIKRVIERCWWLTPVILDTQETEIRRITS
jgi:hypothetical protein